MLVLRQVHHANPNIPFLMVTISPFELAGYIPHQVVSLPFRFIIRHFGERRTASHVWGVPTIWAEVDTDMPPINRIILMYESLEAYTHAPGVFDYLGTIQHTGAFTQTFHFFISNQNATVEPARF
jgi:hypothetical protein